MGLTKFSSALFILAAAVAMMTVADAQVPSCAQKLVPCADYLNGTGTPHASCCGPLKEAVTNEMQCLCSLYNSPGLLESFGINVAQAIRLPGRCNLVSSTCGKALSPTSTPTTSPPPPATPGSGTGGVGRIAWTALPSLLLVWASMMLY